MSVYETKKRLSNQDVDMYRRLRPSALFAMLQEAAISHTEQLGAGRRVTLDRGLLWVVALQRAEIERLPEYGELVTVKSWPGQTMHLLFPRYYTLTDESGSTLLRASTLWTLVDADSRRMVFPEKYGVSVEGIVTGEETALPKPLKKRELAQSREFTVPYSYVDLNGHMNNTRYFDLAEDCLGAPAAGRRLRELRSEYASEARCGESFTVSWGEEDGCAYVAGGGEKRIFSMELEYKLF